MARRRRQDKWQQPVRPLTVHSSHVESGADGYYYEVRKITGDRAVKTYRCPGCDHEIRIGTPHVVVWQARSEDDRRHWHTPCWTNRARRGPTRKWS